MAGRATGLGRTSPKTGPPTAARSQCARPGASGALRAPDAPPPWDETPHRLQPGAHRIRADALLIDGPPTQLSSER